MMNYSLKKSGTIIGRAGVAAVSMVIVGLVQVASAADVEVTLSSAAGNAEDTYLSQATPTTNAGNGLVSYVGGSATDFRGVFRVASSAFPVIPDGQEVTGATLTLFPYIASRINPATTIELHRSLKPWTENGATWNTYDGSNAWASAGMTDGGGTPDYDSALIGSGHWNANDTPIVFDITTAYLGWTDGGWDNDGLAIYITGDESTESYVGFYSTEASSGGIPGFDPILTVTYGPATIPEPASMALMGIGSMFVLRRKR